MEIKGYIVDLCLDGIHLFYVPNLGSNMIITTNQKVLIMVVTINFLRTGNVPVLLIGGE